MTFLLLLLAPLPGQTPASSYQIIDQRPFADPKLGEIVVEAQDHATKEPLPVRVIVTAADSNHPDGSGNGVYADGRFFADGKFTVQVPPGKTKIVLRSGPNYVPLEIDLEAKVGRGVTVLAKLRRWFAPEQRGWYSGDNHVHAQHDAKAVVKTSLAYTALQARANGLRYITEAGSASAINYDEADKLNTKTFLLRHAQEQRPGPFVGHLNTPGIKTPIPQERLAACLKQPLPRQALAEVVHDLGGVVIHTHPMTPAHLIHWMGAGEVYSDAVLGRCADLLDVDSRHTEQLWFAVLNLGNKVAVSSYTDCALGRLQTLSPGDRRVYCHAKEFTYPAIVEALRQGRTFATNGGPVFPFFTLDGKEPGAEIKLAAERLLPVKLEVQCLHPLRSAQLICRGNAVHSFEVAGQKGSLTLTHEVREKGAGPAWYCVRVEDELGNWAITSPVYLELARPMPRPFASAVLFEIGNHTRFIQLRKEFFAHVIVTVGPDDTLAQVELLKDGKVVQSFKPELGNKLSGDKVPATEIEGDYGPGWIWHPRAEKASHFQADWPVPETGWYQVRATTVGQRVLLSDALHFDAAAGNSHAISVAHLAGIDTRLTLRGYGEEMPLADIRLPFNGDHWWYPNKAYWRLQMQFGGQRQELTGGGFKEAAGKFRDQ